MHALLINLVLFGQVEVGLPPAPPALLTVPQSAAPAETLDDLRSWLLSRLIVDMSFDARKSAEAERLIKSLDEKQMREMIAYYKERTAKRDQVKKPLEDSSQQQALEQATLNLQQLQAYRDHLKREYDRQILQGQMTQNLVYQNIVNNQRMMYLTNGSIISSPFGFAPYYGAGYGMMNYGGFGGMGYGYPGYGTSMMYGSPYFVAP